MLKLISATNFVNLKGPFADEFLDENLFKFLFEMQEIIQKGKETTDVS